MIYLAFALAALSLAAFAVAIWSLSWPRVKGTIDVSIYDEELVESDDLLSPKEVRGRFYVAYSYTVGGVALRGGRVGPLANLDWQISDRPELGNARGRAQWYREGAVVDVYYCPLRPQWACLEPGGFLMAGLVGIFAAMSFALA